MKEPTEDVCEMAAAYGKLQDLLYLAEELVNIGFMSSEEILDEVRERLGKP